MAIERAGDRRADIGMVIGGLVGAGHRHAGRGLQHRAARSASRCRRFDVNSACTSFFVQLHLLSMMRPEALPPFVLLVVAGGA